MQGDSAGFMDGVLLALLQQQAGGEGQEGGRKRGLDEEQGQLAASWAWPAPAPPLAEGQAPPAKRPALDPQQPPPPPQQQQQQDSLLQQPAANTGLGAGAPQQGAALAPPAPVQPPPAAAGAGAEPEGRAVRQRPRRAAAGRRASSWYAEEEELRGLGLSSDEETQPAADVGDESEPEPEADGDEMGDGVEEEDEEISEDDGGSEAGGARGRAGGHGRRGAGRGGAARGAWPRRGRGGGASHSGGRGSEAASGDNKGGEATALPGLRGQGVGEAGAAAVAHLAAAGEGGQVVPEQGGGAAAPGEQQQQPAAAAGGSRRGQQKRGRAADSGGHASAGGGSKGWLGVNEKNHRGTLMWRPTFGANLNSAKGASKGGTKRYQSMALCDTREEAGVAHDLGVMWREVQYTLNGDDGDVLGQGYNFAFASYLRLMPGLLKLLAALPSYVDLQAVVAQLRRLGSLAQLGGVLPRAQGLLAAAPVPSPEPWVEALVAEIVAPAAGAAVTEEEQGTQAGPAVGGAPAAAQQQQQQQRQPPAEDGVAAGDAGAPAAAASAAGAAAVGAGAMDVGGAEGADGGAAGAAGAEGGAAGAAGEGQAEGEGGAGGEGQAEGQGAQNPLMGVHPHRKLSTPKYRPHFTVQVDENNLPTLGLGAKRKKLSLSLAMCDSPEEAGVARDIGVMWKAVRYGPEVSNPASEAYNFVCASYQQEMPGLTRCPAKLPTYVELLEFVAALRDNEKLAALATVLPRAGVTQAHFKGRTLAQRAPDVVAKATQEIAAAAAAAAAGPAQGQGAATAAGAAEAAEPPQPGAGSPAAEAVAGPAAVAQAAGGRGEDEGDGGEEGGDGDDEDFTEDEGTLRGASRGGGKRRRVQRSTYVGVGIRRHAEGGNKFRPSMEVLLDAAGAPDPKGRPTVAVLAFCGTAAEAGVARDIGVIWRELKYGEAGDVEGQRYNYAYSDYQQHMPGLPEQLVALALPADVRKFTEGLQQEGSLSRLADLMLRWPVAQQQQQAQRAQRALTPGGEPKAEPGEPGVSPRADGSEGPSPLSAVLDSGGRAGRVPAARGRGRRGRGRGGRGGRRRVPTPQLEQHEEEEEQSLQKEREGPDEAGDAQHAQQAVEEQGQHPLLPGPSPLEAGRELPTEEGLEHLALFGLQELAAAAEASSRADGMAASPLAANALARARQQLAAQLGEQPLHAGAAASSAAGGGGRGGPAMGLRPRRGDQQQRTRALALADMQGEEEEEEERDMESQGQPGWPSGPAQQPELQRALSEQAGSKRASPSPQPQQQQQQQQAQSRQSRGEQPGGRESPASQQQQAAQPAGSELAAGGEAAEAVAAELLQVLLDACAAESSDGAGGGEGGLTDELVGEWAAIVPLEQQAHKAAQLRQLVASGRRRAAAAFLRAMMRSLQQ